MIHLINAIVFILAAAYIYVQHQALVREHKRANANARHYWALAKELEKWKHYHAELSKCNAENFRKAMDNR